MGAELQEDFSKKYKDTIDLPQTEFPMRGNGAVREPEFQAKWNEQNIYHKNLEERKKSGAAPFILHDGPPYLSSDKIHIGTALNKILKDIITKYKAQQGFYTPYIPGYDSHGLPIENAVVKKIKGGRAAVSVPELRKKCAEFALSNVTGQEAQFKRLGVWGDWDKPYITLQPKYEAEQIRLFGEMAQKGYIYRGLKPVYWSYGCETALADAEVEYNDQHVSNSIYVGFKTNPESVDSLKPELKEHFDLLKDTRVVIWTTTPWTLPGNLAICLHKNFDYVIVEAKTKPAEDSDEVVRDLGKLLLAKDLVDAFAKEAKLEIKALTEPFKGALLEGLTTAHPLYERPSPIIFGEHVTTEAGTGCVHTAPGHGQDDFIVGKEFGLDILCPVNGKGVYTAEAENGKRKEVEIQFEGMHVIKDGNDKVIEALTELGALINRSKITHSYPYCWRSKTPLLYRATNQWFASVDGFRKEALAAVDNVSWIPQRGRNRIFSMIEERGDWCISRQRVWGVPIPAFYDKTKLDEYGNPEPILDLDVMEHVAAMFAEQGSDIWYEKEIKDLLPEGAKYNPEDLIKETDTMDVWFDSGSSHRSVVAQRADEYLSGDLKEVLPVDLYLEGSDQHRGWFQSSLLTSVATSGKAPYKSVLTHGFVMDEKGRKMSKSLGNVVDPDKVMKQYGADILRLWVASVDYSVDIKVGDAMFKQLADIYRNLRNTSRYMLGNLHDFNPETDTVAYDDLWDVDRYMLHSLQSLIKELTEDFDKYEFFKYYQMLQNFCAVDLSAFYFDLLKDRLYTHGTNSPSRRSAQTVLFEMLSALNRLFVPVLPHLAEDVYQHAPEKVKAKLRSSKEFGNLHEGADSILLSNWPKVNKSFVDKALADKWEQILEIRDVVNKELEEKRNAKVFGKSLEATVTLGVRAEIVTLLKSVENELKAIFIISDLKLEEAGETSALASKFEAEKCVRCWKFFPENDIKEGICPACTEAITKYSLA